MSDGRTVDPDANPTWLGYSTGRWDGDAFVVDTGGFNGKAWLDQLGRPSTDRLHVIERFTRPDVGRLVIDVTIDDPGAYTRPWSVRQEILRLSRPVSSRSFSRSTRSCRFPASGPWSR